MKVVYFTSGITGTGRIVRGISIGNALKRKKLNCEYIILSFSHFAQLCDIFTIKHVEIPRENEEILSEKNYRGSVLYNTLQELNPDILLVDLLWFRIQSFADRLKFKKIFLCRQVSNDFFQISTKSQEFIFNPSEYDLIISTEPFDSKINFTDTINPLVIRNRDEILTGEDAATQLRLNKNKKNCLIAYNGHPGEFEKVVKKYSSLEDEGYDLYLSSNYEGGIFPATDYFNAFDLLVCGAGYNSYWEARYFEKETIFVPTSGFFETGDQRLKDGEGFFFKENGADQLVDIMMNL